MYDGYIRVSRKGDREEDDPSFISPDEQRRAIQAFADASQLEVQVHEAELDVTGSKLVRPILDRIMERIVSGKSEGIIVAKVNRLSRAGLGDAIKLVEQIIDAGATVGFVELGNVDPKTPAGEMIVNIWLSIARMQWREYRESWATSRKRAVERGAFVGPTPLGFQRPKKGQRLEHSDDAPLVREVFEISGTDGLHAALALCERTWPDRHWTITVLRKMLAARIYLGDVISGEFVGYEVVDPIVDRTTWGFAQHPAPRTRASNGTYPLSGIARCANCGGPLVGHLAGRPANRKRSYRCTAKDCALRPHVFADPLETLVLDVIRKSDVSRGGLDAEAIFQFSKAIMEASHELEQYVTTVKIADTELWQRGLEAREAAFESAQRAYDDARERHRELPSLDTTDPTEQRVIFESVVEALTVCRGREQLDDRVAVTLVAAD